MDLVVVKWKPSIYRRCGCQCRSRQVSNTSPPTPITDLLSFFLLGFVLCRDEKDWFWGWKRKKRKCRFFVLKCQSRSSLLGWFSSSSSSMSSLRGPFQRIPQWGGWFPRFYILRFVLLLRRLLPLRPLSVPWQRHVLVHHHPRHRLRRNQARRI